MIAGKIGDGRGIDGELVLPRDERRSRRPPRSVAPRSETGVSSPPPATPFAPRFVSANAPLLRSPASSDSLSVSVIEGTFTPSPFAVGTDESTVGAIVSAAEVSVIGAVCRTFPPVSVTRAVSTRAY